MCPQTPRRTTLVSSDHSVYLNIPSTKTDVFKQGQSAVIKAFPQLGTLCPVSLLTNYKRRSFRNGADGLLFAKPSKSNPHATLSRDRLTKRLKNGLADAVVDAAKYSLHSLRAGGTTAAAAAGTGNERIANHGRWRFLKILILLFLSDKLYPSCYELKFSIFIVSCHLLI